MGSEYDHKFQEMKKYIPFLESMIKRLESNSSSSNPRQAQLDKIRSLRDLLLDKKKRMKMDNLLKCEQVLVNLYAKVEHTRDSIPLARIEKTDSRAAEDPDLSIVRNKLKSFTKSQNTTETLPEIARASEREEICEPGSKEPALFQRRPNKSSLSPVNYSPRKSHEAKSPKGQSKRYTRVLVSPERQRRWSGNEEPSMESPLFSRRSPRPSRKTSPTYHKKERKKSMKSRDRSSQNENHENFNITLKVPEDKLHSLNTDDIISRIITCSDGDVDIATLRELRTQILGELKQTGKNDDISELILKSYNKKSKPRKKKKHEVEEGEISDSESEVIDSVYGSLAVVLDKDKKQGLSKTGEKNNPQRKIQICLVLNSDKEGENEPQSEMDLSETGVFQNKDNDFLALDSETLPSPNKKNESNQDQVNNSDVSITDINCQTDEAENDKTQDKTETIKPNSTDADVAKHKNENNKPEPEVFAIESKNKPNQPEKNDAVSETRMKCVTPTKTKDSLTKTDISPSKIPYSPSDVFLSPSPVKIQNGSKPTKNVANYYTPQPEDLGRKQTDNSKDATPLNDCPKSDTGTTAGNKISDETKTEDVEIPLLHEPHLPPKAKKDVLSEIDILQALKNEILSETIPIASTEADTPALHKPILTKVTQGTDTSSLKPKATGSKIETSSVPITKKRISIENYKKKSETVAKSLFVKKRSNAEREELRKQSLKLTEKECERFNLTRLSLDDEDDYISDDDLLDYDKPLSLNDIYSNLAPKSPDQDSFDDDFDIPMPTEIPTDPVNPIVPSAADEDLRSLATPKPVLPPVLAVSLANIAGTSKSTPIIESKNLAPDGNRKPPADPRIRRDLSQPTSKESPNAYKPPSLEGTPRPSHYPNIPPLLGMTPVYTPSYAPSMTPIRTPNARSYEMTPTHQTFDIEEPSQKHVYAPSFPFTESREREFPVTKDRPVWELNKNDDVRSRRENKNKRWETNHPKDSPVQRDLPSYNPRTDKYYIDRRDSYSKQDSPSTPGSTFGRSDGSSTPARLEAPTTPSHPLGRSDCPSTPIHPFGRSDCPTTPSHPFGRSECPTTPSHPFGRSDYKDPRFNRKQSEYESHSLHDDKDRGYQLDRGYNRSNSYRSHGRQFSDDSPRNYDREQKSYGRSDRYSNNPYRYSKSNVNDHQRHFEQEPSIGRSDKSFANELSGRYDRTRHEFSQNRDNSRLFTRDRDRHCDYENSHRNLGESKSLPQQNRSSRARSVGRIHNENLQSVKVQIGHTFTIDTSVNATFQKFLESGKGIQVFDYTMDSRRQRATSVGRSLVRDNNFVRTLPHEDTVGDSTFIDRRKRASSVGRSLVNDKKTKTLTEMKADFKSFQLKSFKVSESLNASCSMSNDSMSGTIEKDTRESSSGENKYEESLGAKLNTKTQYSPKKNYRDPRMRKDIKDPRNKKERYNSHSLDRRHSGIVYSNDNIAKGTIMGTGFGVKNYKIPKIKKPEPERPKTPDEEPKEPEKAKTPSVTLSVKKNKHKGKKNPKFDDEESETVVASTLKTKKMLLHDSLKDRNKERKDRVNQKVINSDDESDVRVTRSSKKSDPSSTAEKTYKKTRRVRQIVDDSDSEEAEIESKHENNKRINKEQPNKCISITKTKLSKVSTKQNDFEEPTIDKESDKHTQQKNTVESDISSTEKVLRKTLEDDESFDSSFGIDDIEMFTDGIVTDKESDKHTQQKNTVESDVSSTEKVLRKTLEDDESFDSSFGIDDIEMFTDGIVTGPVINDIIADLDKQISGPKSANDNCNAEMEKIMGENDNQEENTLCDISDYIEKDLNNSNENFKQTLNDTSTLNDLDLKKNLSSITPIATPSDKQNIEISRITQTENAFKTVAQLSSCDEKLNSNDETVSTTQFQGRDLNQIAQDGNKLNEDILITPDKGHLAPDSTIVQSNNLSNKPEESLPDSTIEIHSEVSSEVTSTLNDTEKHSKESTEQPASCKEVSAIESFGSLLSILQDKAKIKELLLMLGEKSGDTEKIKKKLEKLSEIVSDEEDANKDEQKNDYDSNSSEVAPKTTESQVTQKDVENQRKDELVNKEIPVSEKVEKELENVENELDKAENELVKDSKKDDVQSDRIEVPDLESEKAIIGKATDTTSENCEDPEHDEQTNDEMIDEHDHIENQDEENTHDKTLKTSPKKGNGRGRTKGRTKKGKFAKKNVVYKNESSIKVKEIKPKIQKAKASRELKTLQNDLKEMFICKDVMNATGIRMCRLAKLVDKKRERSTPPEDELAVLDKCKDVETAEEPVKKVRKKPGPKPKPRIATEPTGKKNVEKEVKVDKPKNRKPGPKSKTKQKQEADPYEFDTDSMADTNTTKESDAYSSDSESDTAVSSSSEGSEVLADIIRKPKKKRGIWQTGVIKPKYKKKKNLNIASTSSEVIKPMLPLKPFSIPDLNCFTDKMYCFQRGVVAYDCRLCHYSGTEIVSHYKKQHAHTEVPLSRMDPVTAKKAIEQCERVNFQAISKIPSEKYTCRFCYKEFSKNKVALENFFWHVVSTHTGEYKHLCYECVNVTRCPFNLDIPPPPKEIKGQLIGYICGKCNFTQISLENLKTHVIVRHNDEQTEVFTINLGVISQKAMKAMLRKSLAEELGDKPRTLRSSRSNVSFTGSDDRSEIYGSDVMSEISSTFPKKEDPHEEAVEIKRKPKPGPLKSKLRFEADYQDQNIQASVKSETELDTDNHIDTSQMDDTTDMNDPFNETESVEETPNDTSQLDQTVPLNQTKTIDTEPQHETVSKADEAPPPRATSDIFELPHFKLNFKDNGSKEYICCVNGEQNHYRTTLLISLKKHVQSKHFEKWDGYCYVCKVIVTLQGVQSSFKDCLTHFLDKHMDDFPIMEKIVENTNEDSRSSMRSSIDAPTERTESPRAYIAVRRLSDLISKNVDPPISGGRESPFPVIENVVTLGDRPTVKPPRLSPVYPSTSAEVVEPQPVKPFEYEEVQAVVMSKKHRIVLDVMMAKEVLVRVFKCAGRFCSFTSDSAEDALVHASAHKQLGGEGALDCAYCNFDAAGNAIDLVMHVFKAHGRCQFSCELCFYRAAADQLVGAHFAKAHGTSRPVTVLRATSFLGPVPADTTGMLPRETAVPYYICNHGKGICKFRTYTPGKYCEHMQQKHATAETHPCNLCVVTASTPADLVKHMKDHGLKLYQCTWCVYGANTEPDMLSHAATMHPTKNPQAYLRIITNKDGSTDLRVLPLIYLNKLKVPVEDVIPNKVNDNPIKNAERSIQLENLISSSLATSNTVNVPQDTETPEEIKPPAEIIAEPGDITDVQTAEAIEKSILSSPQKTQVLDTDSILSSIVKKDSGAKETNQRFDEIYSLDSDDEQESPIKNLAKENVVIDLSDEEPADNPPAATEQAVKATEQAANANEQAAKASEQAAKATEQAAKATEQAAKAEATKATEQAAKAETAKATEQAAKAEAEKAIEQAAKANEQAAKTSIDKPKFKKLPLDQLYKCPDCSQILQKLGGFKRHTNVCCLELVTIRCPHDPCPIVVTNITQLINHYNKDHNVLNVAKQYYCGECNMKAVSLTATKKHLKDWHNVTKVTIATQKEDDGTYTYKVHKETKPGPRAIPKRKTSVETPKKFGIADVDKLPLNPILDSLVYCNICEFSTKVRLNMVRHLQLHAERQPVPQTVPVNPVPVTGNQDKHFDKMVNLASSSAATRPEQRPPAIALDVVTRYPKYVPDRQRHTCGAKGCAYISVDEAMLRIHWNTLHSGAVDYHCVHCPPNQHLDTTKSLTANRIIAHLKMHDANLYACSSCSYYHHRKHVVAVHISDVHKEKGQLQVVREDGIAVSATPTPSVGSVGTMDLKPWQCGLCSFKSMLRQSVVEHCSKEHQTKMQYKCTYCPFRTSGIENIVKHQSNAHPNRAADVFYYYYREGTVPDDKDNTPRWQKQRQNACIQDQVKSEREPDSTPVQPLPKTVPIDLNLVKKETEDGDIMSVEDLCKIYGQFCEPNGISYKCPLCKIVSEYTREAMQFHLFEELKYRRWGCAICPYKAYHKIGLNEHMLMEHRRNFMEPTELPVNKNIEKWVLELLNHQSSAIEKSKTNPLLVDMTKNQPKALERAIPGPSKVVVAEPVKSVQAFTDSELEEAFGVFGAPKDDSYCCPKCNVNIKAEDEIRNHLESELTKIRWCCTKCTDKFPTFHEAQFHCKSHPGLLTRPKEAVRDPALRAAWVTSVVNTQKKSMKPEIAYPPQRQSIDLSDTSDNSLLVVRYEEPVSTDELMRHPSHKAQTEESRKRPAESDSDDSEDSMVIYEPESKKINDRNCPYCDFVTRSDSQYKMCLKEHILRHFNLGILTCAYCNFNGTRRSMRRHVESDHSGKPHDYMQTEIPNCIPSQFKLRARKPEKTDVDLPKKVCLHCEASVPINELDTHMHGNKKPEFKEKGDIVTKCCICLTLCTDLEAMQVHYKESHIDITKLNYAFYRLQIDTREVQSCGICFRRFTFLRDLRIHHTAMHGSHSLNYTTVPFRPDEDDHETRKRKLEEVSPTTKRVAKKSTSKLPQNNVVAKKSTTKLPLLIYSDSDSETEYSYYGSKPLSIDKYPKVKTMMSMFNTVVEVDVTKLSGLLKIDPKVVVKDIKK